MTNPAQLLNEQLDRRTARVGVVGLGYVGLPTAVAFANAGFNVIGVDRDLGRAESINNGLSHIEGVPAGTVAALVRSGKLRAVSSLEDAGPLDVIDICVPTPLDKTREPDVSAILSVVDELRVVARVGQLIILTSTSYPGTTSELIQPVLEGLGLTVGESVFVAFAPERIDPGNTHFTFRNTPKVVGGATPACTTVATQLFETVVDRVAPVSSPSTAETVKLLENTFRSVNIALANEMAIMCRYLGVDVWEVVDAASTKPYGFMPFFPGPGLGGHCIPVDPSYLSWKLRGLNYVARFIGLAEDINRHMPEHVLGRIVEILNERSRSLRGSRVLLLGVAYKPDVGDLRESPALDIMSLLLRRGANVAFCDPHISEDVHVDGITMSALPVTDDLLSHQDLVVITTAHSAFDRQQVRQHAHAVLDTRGWGRSDGKGLAQAHWHTL